MKQLSILIAMSFFAFSSLSAIAQVDPNAWVSSDPASTSGEKSDSTSSAEGLDTERYVKKPSAKKVRRPANDDDDDLNNNAPSSRGRTAGDGDQNSSSSQGLPLPRIQPGPQPWNQTNTYDPQDAPQAAPNATPARPPNFGHKMRDMLLGGDPEMIDEYRSFLDAEDIRRNIFEFTLATSYLYDTSLSPYSYRNYLDSAPTAFVGLDLWITPFIGIDADYRSTLLDSVNDSQTLNNFINVNHTWFDLGLHFRRFFGMSASAANLTVGLRYADYRFSAPPSAMTKMSIHDQAPELTLDAAMPITRNFSWTLGLSLQPFVTQNEIVGNTNLTSGQSNQTVEFGASLGGEYRMSRQTRAFFKFSADAYRTQFSGAANAIDPVTGTAPNNVPVTNMFYMFDIGLKLGR